MTKCKFCNALTLMKYNKTCIICYDLYRNIYNNIDQAKIILKYIEEHKNESNIS